MWPEFESQLCHSLVVHLEGNSIPHSCSVSFIVKTKIIMVNWARLLEELYEYFKEERPSLSTWHLRSSVESIQIRSEFF